MRRSSGIFCAVAFLAATPHAYAGAWTQDQGRALLILSGNYYAADRMWDNFGRKQSQPSYSKYELNPYMEYGLWEGVTLGTNLSLDRTYQQGTGGSAAQSNWGIGDSEFFLRQRLWQGSGFIVSAEPMIKLPSPESGSSQPRLGSSHPDAGIGLSAGYSFSALGRNHFVDIDSQYRYRFGSPRDQYKFAATLGIGFTSRLTLMPQMFATYRASPPKIASFTQSASDDYDLTRLQLSAVYQLREDVSLQVGGFSDISGRNAGIGRGALIALWKRL